MKIIIENVKDIESFKIVLIDFVETQLNLIIHLLRFEFIVIIQS